MLRDHYFVSLHSRRIRLYLVYPESEGNECEDILKGRCRERRWLRMRVSLICVVEVMAVSVKWRTKELSV